MDKGLKFVLECCRSLFNFARKRRHLPPYAENPFQILEIDRIPVEQARVIELFSAEQERAFFKACDHWQFPLFLTLILTGLRPGELCHLILPDDLNLDAGVLRIRNKPRLGWQVKTRNEREIPLVPVLVDVLRRHLGTRQHGPLFRRRRYTGVDGPSSTMAELEKELANRIESLESAKGQRLDRKARLGVARGLWRNIGAVEIERVRIDFMRLTKAIGMPLSTAPKMLRHQFATALQEGRVDPLIRNELMGHVAGGERTAGHGLGMTAIYTHTSPETKRRQLEEALSRRPAAAVAEEWLARERRT